MTRFFAKNRDKLLVPNDKKGRAGSDWQDFAFWFRNDAVRAMMDEGIAKTQIHTLTHDYFVREGAWSVDVFGYFIVRSAAPQAVQRREEKPPAWSVNPMGRRDVGRAELEGVLQEAAAEINERAKHAQPGFCTGCCVDVPDMQAHTGPTQG